MWICWCYLNKLQNARFKHKDLSFDSHCFHTTYWLL